MASGYFYISLILLVCSTLSYIVRGRNQALYLSKFRTRKVVDNKIAFFYNDQLMISSPQISEGALTTPKLMIGNLSLFERGLEYSIGYYNDSFSFATKAKCFENGTIMCDDLTCNTLRLKPGRNNSANILTIDEGRLGSMGIGSVQSGNVTITYNNSYSPYIGNARGEGNDFVKFDGVMGKIMDKQLEVGHITGQSLGMDKDGNCVKYRTINFKDLLPPNNSNTGQFLRNQNGTLTWTLIEKFENEGLSLMSLDDGFIKQINIDTFPRSKRLDNNGRWSDTIQYDDGDFDGYLTPITSSNKYLNAGIGINFDGVTGQVLTLTDGKKLELRDIPRRSTTIASDVNVALVTFRHDGVSRIFIDDATSSDFVLGIEGDVLNKLRGTFFFADMKHTSETCRLVIWNGTKFVSSWILKPCSEKNQLLEYTSDSLRPINFYFYNKLSGEKDLSLYCLNASTRRIIRFDLDTPIDNNQYYLTYGNKELKWTPAIYNKLATKFAVINGLNKLGFSIGRQFKMPLIFNNNNNNVQFIEQDMMTSKIFVLTSRGELTFESFSTLFDDCNTKIRFNMATNDGLLMYDVPGEINILSPNDNNIHLCVSIRDELKYLKVSDNVNAKYILGFRSNRLYKDDTLNLLMNLPKPDLSSNNLSCLTYFDRTIQYHKELNVPTRVHFDSILIHSKKNLTWIAKERVFYNQILNQFENIHARLNHPAIVEEEVVLFNQNGQLSWLPFGDETFQLVNTKHVSFWLGHNENQVIFHQSVNCNSRHIIWIQLEITLTPQQQTSQKSGSYLQLVVKMNDTIKNHFFVVFGPNTQRRDIYFNNPIPGKNVVTVSLLNKHAQYILVQNQTGFIFRFS